MIAVEVTSCNRVENQLIRRREFFVYKQWTLDGDGQWKMKKKRCALDGLK